MVIKLPSPKSILSQIQRLTPVLIKSGLTSGENFPSLKECANGIIEIGITNADHSVFLKNLPYVEMYKTACKSRAYNIKMLDGALITLQYRFRNKDLIAHRLSFFPDPELVAFQNEPLQYIEDEIYADIISKGVFPVPFRFDFDNDEKVCKPIEHPISHFTLGQYKNCRIPVSSALTPYQFIRFITRNFYHNAYLKIDHRELSDKETFEPCIFSEDQELIHLKVHS